MPMKESGTSTGSSLCLEALGLRISSSSKKFEKFDFERLGTGEPIECISESAGKLLLDVLRLD